MVQIEQVVRKPWRLKSRTAYVICMSNCPFLWIGIALSRRDAEYVSLSMVMHDSLPSKRLMQSIFTMLMIYRYTRITILLKYHLCSASRKAIYCSIHHPVNKLLTCLIILNCLPASTLLATQKTLMLVSNPYS